MNISKFTHYDYKESGRNIDQLFKFYRCISLDLPQTVHSEWSKTIPGIGSLEWVWYSLPPASLICRKVMFSVVSISVHGRVIPMRFRPFQTCSLKQECHVFRTDKIPWLFPDFSSIFFQFSSIFLGFFFFTENLIHFSKQYTVHLNITKNNI